MELQAMKRRVRKITDRVMAPYVEDLRCEIRARSDAPAPMSAPADRPAFVTSDRFHNLNHTLRTLAFEEVPRGTKRMVSVGAAGRWYFDWAEQCLGPLEEHIGVEAFEEMPDDLPDNVRWVKNTADQISDVVDGWADLVFAGQTTEHLWAHELTGFLCEANRVLRSGGVLVIDSPNREVTEHLFWSHGGHTIELSLGEIVELLELAGFEVRRQHGIWRCRFGDDIMQLEEGLESIELTARRIATAPSHPQDSFVWWVEAEKVDAVADPAAIRHRVDELFRRHWPTRVSRGMWPGPPARSVEVTAGSSGVLFEDLPFPLHPGTFRLSMELLEGSIDDLEGLTVEVFAPVDVIVHHLRADTAIRRGATLSWDFVHHHLWFALSIRVRADRVRRDVVVGMPIELTELAVPVS
jgi:hypothetical protein